MTDQTTTARAPVRAELAPSDAFAPALGFLRRVWVMRTLSILCVLALWEWAGRIPNPGERFLVRGLEIDIIEASPTKIERLIIRSSDTPVPSLAAGFPG